MGRIILFFEVNGQVVIAKGRLRSVDMSDDSHYAHVWNQPNPIPLPGERVLTTELVIEDMVYLGVGVTADMDELWQVQL